MKKIFFFVILVSIAIIYSVGPAEAESKAVIDTKNLQFFGTKSPIGKLVKSHPLVESSSIKWSELDPRDEKFIVLCEFYFYTPAKQDVPVQIIFAVGEKGGKITQIQSLHPYDGGTHLCLNLGIFLKALEEKKDLNYAVLGYTKSQFEEVAEYDKDYSIYLQKMRDAEHPRLSKKAITDLRKMEVGYIDPYGRQMAAGCSLGAIVEVIPNKLVEGTQQRLALDVLRDRSRITLIVTGDEGNKVHFFFDVKGDNAVLFTGLQFRGKREGSMAAMMVLENFLSLEDAEPLETGAESEAKTDANTVVEKAGEKVEEKAETKAEEKAVPCDTEKTERPEIRYYKDGTVKSVIPHKRGILGGIDGTAKYYSKDGKLTAELFYEKGEIKRKKQYYSNGNLRREEEIKDREFHGMIREYYENGQLKNEDQYKNNRCEGLHRDYYENGQLRSESYRNKNGLPYGTAKAYYQDGQLKREVQHGDNYGDISRKRYYDNGQLETEGREKKSKRHGPYITYWKNGEIKTEGNYKNGKKEGVYKEYHKNGLPKKEESYKDNKKDGVFKHYYKNGQVEKVESYRGGKKEGVFKQYSRDGQLRKEGSYKDGRKDGVFKVYFGGNSLREEGSYSNGKKDGVFKWYHPEGPVEIEAYYENGREKDVRRRYDREGNLIEETVID